MILTIDDITKGIFRFEQPLDNTDEKLKIGIKKIDYGVGFYNIYETQTCRWGRVDQDSEEFTIDPGLYTFNKLATTLTNSIQNFNITLDKTTGLIDISLSENVQLWLPEAIKYMLGITHEDWIQNGYEGDQPVEFLPAGGIYIYLNELSTSKNLRTNAGKIVGCRLLGIIPMLSENFAQYVSLHFDKPCFKELTASNIHQFEFSLKLRWKNGAEHRLDNHHMPIRLVLEIK